MEVEAGVEEYMSPNTSTRTPVLDGAGGVDSPKRSADVLWFVVTVYNTHQIN